MLGERCKPGETILTGLRVFTDMETNFTDSEALVAYEGFAPFYDLFTEAHDHERWLLNLEAIALEHGLRGKRLLDVACGTGKSFMPLVRRGYEVVACDLSPAMVAQAKARLAPPLTADVLVADMRSLPLLGSFDFATCISDALNYLLTEEELVDAFTGVAANLRPGGMFFFDLNTLATYRHFFARDMVSEVGDALFCWRGDGEPDPAPGCMSSARIEIFASDGSDGWRRTTSEHVQRHHPPALIRSALEQAGLELVLVHGLITASEIEPEPDDDYHRKLIYLARRGGGEEVTPMSVIGA